MPNYVICDSLFISSFWVSATGAEFSKVISLLHMINLFNETVLFHTIHSLIHPLIVSHFSFLHPQGTILLYSMCFCLFYYAFLKHELYNVKIF